MRAAEWAAQIKALEIKEEERRQTAYAADMAIAYQSWELGRAELARRLLEDQRPPQGRIDLRGWEWRYLWAQTRSREVHQFKTDSPYGFWSCAISPDGNTVAGGVVEGFVERWDLRTEKSLGALNPLAGVNPVDGIRFSRDGRKLWQSLRTSGEVVMWDLGTQKSEIRFGSKRPGLRLALSPDEHLLATADGSPSSANGPGEVRLWLTDSGQELARTELQPTYLTRAEFSPDGMFLATVGSRGYARIWSVPNLHEIAVLAVAKQMPQFQYDPAKGSFRAWLYTQARWRIADSLRRCHRHNRTQAMSSIENPIHQGNPPSLAEPMTDPLEALWEAEWRENQLNRALAQVKAQVNPGQFQMFQLVAIKGWEMSEITRTLKVSRAQVYMAKMRVGRLLRRALDRLSD